MHPKYFQLISKSTKKKGKKPLKRAHRHTQNPSDTMIMAATEISCIPGKAHCKLPVSHKHILFSWLWYDNWNYFNTTRRLSAGCSQNGQLGQNLKNHHSVVCWISSSDTLCQWMDQKNNSSEQYLQEFSCAYEHPIARGTCINS